MSSHRQKTSHVLEPRWGTPGPPLFLKERDRRDLRADSVVTRKKTNLGGEDQHYLSCSHNWACLVYAVSLRTEVSEVEGREDASAGPCFGLHHCL